MKREDYIDAIISPDEPSSPEINIEQEKKKSKKNLIKSFCIYTWVGLSFSSLVYGIGRLASPYILMYDIVKRKADKSISILDFRLTKSCPIQKQDSNEEIAKTLKEKIQSKDVNHILNEESIDAALDYISKNTYIDPCDVSKKIDHLKVETAPMRNKQILGTTYYSSLPFQANLIVIQDGLSEESLTFSNTHEQIHTFTNKVPILEEPITSYFGSFLTKDNSYHVETTMLRMLIEVVGIDPILKADAIGSLEPIETELLKLNPDKDRMKELFQTFQVVSESERKMANADIHVPIAKFLSILDNYYQEKNHSSMFYSDLMKAYIIQLSVDNLVVYKDYLYGDGTYFTIGDKHYTKYYLNDLIEQNQKKLI